MSCYRAQLEPLRYLVIRATPFYLGFLCLHRIHLYPIPTLYRNDDFFRNGILISASLDSGPCGNAEVIHETFLNEGDLSTCRRGGSRRSNRYSRIRGPSTRKSGPLPPQSRIQGAWKTESPEQNGTRPQPLIRPHASGVAFSDGGAVPFSS